ncbi:MAG TPA: hypothetical protein VMF60_11010 [Acidimicrobiales bacterium]|nr:hypothetical protein [Acidimicrobiales bacterium]
MRGGAGGGIANNGTLTVSAITFLDNEANNFCGAFCAAAGGGIANVAGGVLTLTSSTLWANSANVVFCGFALCFPGGGGVYNGGTASIGPPSWRPTARPWAVTASKPGPGG